MDGERMVGFGPKQAWLAVRHDDPAKVAEALGLRELGTVGWRAGVDLAYFTDDRLVLTPPLPGAGGDWVLVTGRRLLSTPLSAVALSATLGTEVQSFASHRGVQVHRWERALAGDLLRAFEHDGAAGEVVRWIGVPDAAELAVGLPADDPLVNADDVPGVLVGESDVMRVAAAWSVNPTALDGRPAPGPLLAAAAPPIG